METIEVLLIGGPCDGMRQRVMPGQPSVAAVPMEKLRLLDRRNAEPMAEARRFYTYRRVPLRGDNRAEYDVYVYGDYDVLGTLIKNYRDHVGVDGALEQESREPKSAEQKARDMLERMGVADAQSCSAGELVELANLIAGSDRSSSSITSEALHAIYALSREDDAPMQIDSESTWRLLEYVARKVGVVFDPL